MTTTMGTDCLLSARRAARLFLLLPFATACAGHHHHEPPPGPPVYGEQEPNDWADHPDHIATLDARSHLFVEGHIHEVGPDVYDGFHFLAAEPCTIQFALDARAPADLDLAVYDPFVGDFVLFFETPYDPEIGSFLVLEAGTEFHLVVRSFQGSSDYTLEVLGSPLEAGPSPGIAPLAADLARPSGGGDVRALYGAYRPAPPPPAPEEEPVPALWMRLDEHGRIIEVLPVALHPSRPASL